MISNYGNKPKVGIYWHEECSKHFIEYHPECPARIETILSALKPLQSGLLAFHEAPYATDEHIIMFHSDKLLKIFKSQCEKAAKSKNGIFSIDGDTKIMEYTQKAAYRAVGSIILALDHIYCSSTKISMVQGVDENTKLSTSPVKAAILSRDDLLKKGGDSQSPKSSPSAPFREEINNGKEHRLTAKGQSVDFAFCCVRPPGHHATRSNSQGFCFFNNIGIAAKYAQKQYGVRKVAVLDFDVHHGNGTEDGFSDDFTLFYGSTHEKDNYPGTGPDPSPFVGDKAKSPRARRIVNRTLEPGEKSRRQFREKWQEILSEMELFQPELVLISAGFDAHSADPLASCELIEEDYTWATEAILASCVRINPRHPPKCVSILEGGYDLDALQASALAHVKVLMKGYPSPSVSSNATDDEDGVPYRGGDEVAALSDYLKEVGLSDP